MSRYLLFFKGSGDIPQDDLRTIRDHAGVTVLDVRPSKTLVLELDGCAGDFLADVGKMKDWVASEQRKYRLN
ncbi:hypothetical protein [Burkholderia seminalis]|uniref:hypothetical protein n=1 Tax=Burkholderia seminalis TaxID=488731 RepID=UPI001452BA33|nr:hypothetical protein [Burkholderia seminalis]MCA8434552.1 hypothetical protein [Burkholderia seminalis]VWB91292.1 hypothetical protein BSE24067_04376 [Burkholderia seminalis]